MTILQKLSGACTVLVAATTAANAAPIPAGDAMRRLAPAIGNTIVSTHPDGRKARLWLSAGGTYSAEGRDGGRSGGRWTVKSEKLCLKQRRPIPIPFAYCKAIPTEQVGKPWRDTAVTGEKVTNEIVLGDAGVAN